MTTPPIRVLLVDDSPVVLAVLKKMLADSPEIEVVGTAMNGQEGLEILPRVKPDVICTDLNMPFMDGLEFTRRVMGSTPLPIMVISSQVHDRESKTVFELLKAGAIEILPKPFAGLSSENDRLRKDLINKIKILKGIVVFHKRFKEMKPERTPVAADKPAAPAGKPRIVAIGSSTGGPQALLTILPALPVDFPLPVLCVQHISPGFLEGLIEWLNEHCALKVKIAARGERPRTGRIYFPPEGKHLDLAPDGSFAPSEESPYHGHRPSVNVTFAAVARHYGGESIAVLLTGMGDDGAEGMTQIFQKGGATIAQDQATSTVFGMPRAAIERGVAGQVLSLDEIAGNLLSLAGKR